MTVIEACEAYLRELAARNIRKSTRQNYASVFRQMQAFAAKEGVESLAEFDRSTLRAWREGWTWSAGTQRRVLDQL